MRKKKKYHQNLSKAAGLRCAALLCCFALLCFTSLCLTSCSKKDIYIDCVISDYAILPQENIDAFNSLLAEKGYDFRLKVTYLDGINYSKLLKDNTSDADICFVGTGTNKDLYDVLSSGLFEPLDSYLEGSELYEAIPPKLWQSVKYNGTTYTVPNCAGQNSGNLVIFNLDKLDKSMCEAYDGDITRLPDFLGEDDYIYVDIEGFDFARDYGYDFIDGVLVSEDGKAFNPLDCSEIMSWLTTMNSLYCEGRVKSKNNEGEWAICLSRSFSADNSDNILVYESKGIISTRYTASLGICSSSKQKEESFKLLELLHTDKDLVNALIFGENYVDKDGFAYDESGEPIAPNAARIFWGVDNYLLFTNDRLKHFNSPAEKKDYYENKVTASGALGAAFETDLSAINSAFNNSYLWQTQTFDADIASLRTKLEEAGIQSTLESIQKELDEKRG